jgi:hypothetical protein
MTDFLIAQEKCLRLLIKGGLRANLTISNQIRVKVPQVEDFRIKSLDFIRIVEWEVQSFSWDSHEYSNDKCLTGLTPL